METGVSFLLYPPEIINLYQSTSNFTLFQTIAFETKSSMCNIFFEKVSKKLTAYTIMNNLTVTN